MAFEYANDFNSLTSGSDKGVDVQVDNGTLADSNGNTIYFGTKPTTQFEYRSVADLYVDRVKDATPTGNLFEENGDIKVSGHGPVTLTNAARTREVTTVGGNNGENGDIRLDGNGNVIIQWTETDIVRYGDFTETTIQNAGNVAVLNDTMPSGSGSFYNHSVTMQVRNTADSSDTDGTLAVEPSWASQASTSYTFDVSAENIDQISRDYNTNHVGESAEGRGDFDVSNAGPFDFRLIVVTRYEQTNTYTEPISVF